MDIRINNTTTKFEVWVNIYLAYFFFEIFKFFNRKEPHFAQQVKLEMKVLEKYHCKPTELPLILVNDPAIMRLGVKPGDMIKITRKSATAGESLYYRYVVEA